MPLGLTLFESHQYLRVEFSNSVDPGVLVFVFFVGLGGGRVVVVVLFFKIKFSVF